MIKKFKVKAVFLCLLVLISCTLCCLPKAKLFAQTESSTEVSMYYALLSLGYSDVKDKQSLVIEECIGVEINSKSLNESDKTELFNKIFKELKDFKIILDYSISLAGLNQTIVVTDAQIEENFIFIKLRYLDLPTYYTFNGRIIPDSNAQIKPFDYFEKDTFFNKYYIVLNNPYGTQGGQKSLNLFKSNSYNKVINTVKIYDENITTTYVFDYSSQDDRLYGDFKAKYNYTGLNNNSIYIYQFVFTENLPKTLKIYFVTFNQYMWYIVAIGVTILVIAILYLIVFIKNRMEKRNLTIELESDKNKSIS